MRIRKNTNPSSILLATVGYDGERPETYGCHLNQSPYDVIPITSSGDCKFTNPNLLLPSSSSSSPPLNLQSCTKITVDSVSPDNASECLRLTKEDFGKEPVEPEAKKSKLMVSVMDNALQDSMPSRKEPEAEVENSKLIVSVIDNALEDTMQREKKSPTSKEKENPNILKIYKHRSPPVTNGGDVIVSVIDNVLEDSMPSEKKSRKAKEKKKPIVLRTYKRRIGGDVKSPEAKEKNKAKVAEDSTSGEAEICLSYAPGTEETENLCLKNKAKVAEDSTSGEADICLSYAPGTEETENLCLENKAKVAEDSTSGEAEICLNYTPGETENLCLKNKAKVAEASTSGEAEIWLSYPPATEETENLRLTNKAKVVEASSSVDEEICLSYAPAIGETENLCLKTKANVAEASTSGEAEICLSDPPLIPLEDLQNKRTKISTGSLPIRLFTRGTEPAFKRSFNYRSGLENLPILSEVIPSEDLDDIRNGALGVLLRFYENRFSWSAKLVHELLIHQLVIGKKYEIWTLCGGQPVRFSLKEFEVITGLNCEPFPNESVAVEEDPEFWGRLGLIDNEEVLYFKTIQEKIRNCQNWNSRDRIRLVHLFLICRFLLARHPKAGISRKLTSLVLDREKFEAYPWGRVGFEYLIESVKSVNQDLANFSYCVNGFVQILQVWAYEAIPAIGNEHGGLKKDMMEFPPLLRWKGSRKRCKFDLPVNAEPVFVKHVLGDITEELWDDEEEDLKVNNMLSMISATSGKVFKKRHWEDKGPKRKAKERNEQRDTSEGISLNKKRKSNDSWDKVDDALETFLTLLAYSREILLPKLQTDLAALKAYCSRLQYESGSQTEQEATCSNIRGRKKSKRVKN